MKFTKMTNFGFPLVECVEIDDTDVGCFIRFLSLDYYANLARLEEK